MNYTLDRRRFVGSAAFPLLLGLGPAPARKRRLVVMFSPNGVVPWTFWPEEAGDAFTLKESLKPLEPFKDRTLILKGIANKVRADGDSHMRGIGCLLTGVELFPGNVQGGSDTPAGWAKGLSIDQELREFLQANPATRTRFGSLEFGVQVPERADTWTRMVYTGPNRPVAPIDDPYQMFKKLYGRMKDQQALQSILDDVRQDLRQVRARVGVEDRRLLDDHEAFIRETERQLAAAAGKEADAPAPPEPGVKHQNDSIPQISRMQIDMMVQSFKADFARIATLQYTNSVGGAKMRWIGVNEGHHDLSHKENKDEASQEKLTKINTWFCGELAYLAQKLAATPEPGGEGTLLDNTLIVWTNELGQGNSHTLDDIPFVAVGGGLDWKMGRSLKYDRVAHNRLLLSLAHGFGHRLERFGNPDLCDGGPLHDLA